MKKYVLMTLTSLSLMLLATNLRAQTTSSVPLSEEEIVIKEQTQKIKTLKILLSDEHGLRLIEEGKRIQTEKENKHLRTDLMQASFDAGAASVLHQEELVKVHRMWVRRAVWIGIVGVLGGVGGTWLVLRGAR